MVLLFGPRHVAKAVFTVKRKRAIVFKFSNYRVNSWLFVLFSSLHLDEQYRRMWPAGHTCTYMQEHLQDRATTPRICHTSSMIVAEREPTRRDGGGKEPETQTYLRISADQPELKDANRSLHLDQSR